MSTQDPQQNGGARQPPQQPPFAKPIARPAAAPQSTTSAQDAAPLPNRPILPNQPTIARSTSASAPPSPAPPNQPMLPNQPVLPNRPVLPNQPMTSRPAARPASAAPTAPTPAQPPNQRQVQPAQPATVQTPAPAARAKPANRPIPVSPTHLSADQMAGARPIPVTPAAQTAVHEDAPDEEEEVDVTRGFIRSAPPWMISTAVHMVLIIVLVLIWLPQMIETRVELNIEYAEDLGYQLNDDTLDLQTLDPVEASEPIYSEDLVEVQDPLAAMPELLTALDGATVIESIEAPSIGLALSGRERGKKEALLAKYGGTGKTESAVKMGLDWLAKHQQRDGTWSLTGGYSDGALMENRTSATAMALLAFQGSGQTHKSGEHKDVIARGWAALLKMQDREGNFYTGNVPQHSLYSHAQAAIAVCEIYGMTKDDKFRKPAELAIQYVVRSQAPEGGWKYNPRLDSDTSVTGWFVMALQSALMAELDVPPRTLENITRYLDSVQAAGGSQYGYMKDYDPSVTMTAEGLLCRQYLGWKQSHPPLVAGAEYVNQFPIDWQNKNVYYWYYATQLMHHMEGKHWDKWNRVMRQVLPENQIQTGTEKGSWDPLRPTPDTYAGHGGRLYVTCLSIYMLEVYYRHLPIYKYRLEK